jgi:TPR repeat protein
LIMLQRSWGEAAPVTASGGGGAAYDLAMAYASGSGETPFDLVQAHRWFNVAALCGYRPALAMRAEIAAEMSRDEVVEAQKLARATCQNRLAA